MTNRQVWKFPLTLGENKLKMPTGAHVVSAQIQHEQLVLWAVVNLDMATKENRRIFVAATGQELPDRVGWRHFVDTVQSGGFVAHVFDIQADT